MPLSEVTLPIMPQTVQIKPCFSVVTQVAGTVPSVNTCVCALALYAPVAGLYEKILTGVGFDANSTGFQPAAALSVLGLAFYGVEFICSATNVVVLPFIDLEKRLPRINADLLKRKKQAVEARGEIWTDPEVLDRQEREKAEHEREENRIADLRAKCERRGLDFETENQKYLANYKKR